MPSCYVHKRLPSILQGGLEPYQRSSLNYSWSSLDQELLQDLRAIGVETADTDVKDMYRVQICNLLPVTFVDLVCKVRLHNKG